MQEAMFECIETVNVNKLRIILSNQDHFKNLMRPSSFEGDYGFSFEQLNKYYQRTKKLDSDSNLGYVNVLYKQINKRGRYFAKGGLSLQSLPREIRATISNEYYYDIDMVNAHPVILSHICKTKLEYDAKYLNEYINDRDQIINDIVKLNPTKSYEDIKKLILVILNGGYDSISNYKLTKWISKFKHEIDTIHTLIIKHYPKTYNRVKQLKKKNNNEFNIEGSVMNHVLCDWENAILESIIEYLKNNLIITDNYVCCFDGIMILKSDLEDSDMDVEELIDNLQNHIFDEYDIVIKLKQKEMVGFEMDDSPEEVKPEYFKALDTYYWMDFINDLKNKTWNTIDELKEFSRLNINRVMLVLATGEIYIKKDNDEPFQFINDLPEYIIKFNESSVGGKKHTTEIKEMSFKRLYKKYFINDVKMYNNMKLKPLPPDVDVIEQNSNSRDFNIWTGFKAKLLPKKSINMSLINKVLNHIKIVWADNDENHFRYICSWFHTIFKDPSNKSKVAMVFQSDDQQIGKSIVIENFLIPFVFGHKLSIVEEGIGFATERFNNRMMGKLFVCCEELNNITDTGNYHTTFDTMKKLLTNKTMQIEWKNGAKIEIDSFMNFILFTNNQFSIKVEKGDARYFITQCNPIYRKNFKYFDELADSFTQESADHFFSYMYHMDNAVDVRDIPETKIKQEIKLNCLPNPQRFLYRIKELREEKTDEEYVGWKGLIIENHELTGSQLYSYYRSYCQEEHEKEFSQTKFGRCIGDMICKTKSHGIIKYQLKSIK